MFLNRRCSRNTSYILNCYLCGTSKFQLVLMVVPSSSCLTIFFFCLLPDLVNFNHSLDQCSLRIYCWNISRLMFLIATQRFLYNTLAFFATFYKEQRSVGYMVCFLCLMAYQLTWVILCQSHGRTAVMLFNPYNWNWEALTFPHGD